MKDQKILTKLVANVNEVNKSTVLTEKEVWENDFWVKETDWYFVNAPCGQFVKEIFGTKLEENGCGTNVLVCDNKSLGFCYIVDQKE